MPQNNIFGTVEQEKFVRIVRESIEDPADLRITTDATVFVKVVLGRRMLPVVDILAMDDAAAEPKPAAVILIDLEIGVVPFVVAFVIQSPGLFPNSLPGPETEF